MREPLHRLPAVTLAQLITAGEASPETVTRSFIDAIHERERDVQAFAWFDADRAIAAARELQLVSRRGPLHGLPVAIKDNIDTADIATSYGSPIYTARRSIWGIGRLRMRRVWGRLRMPVPSCSARR